ncbi:ATP-binding protein [Paenibacillus faecis]
MLRKKRKERSTWRIVALLALFLLLLAGFRMLWIDGFYHGDHLRAVGGRMDLRGWGTNEKPPVVTLDGEWEFYPYDWLIGPRAQDGPRAPALIQVPEGWDDHLKPGESTPYGYGTYRLRILVEPGSSRQYSLRITSVRSSSAIYVNGQLLHKSGEPAESGRDYTAGNMPQTVSFQANSRGEMDVVIQAANYKDPREGGIVRSVKFGLKEAVERETQISIAMQQLVAVVFLMHAGYAFIMFLVGNRDRRLLAFSVLCVSAMMMYLLGSDEKLFSYWFTMDYDWSFKLVHMSMVFIAYSMIRCVKDQVPRFWSKLSPGYAALCGAGLLLAVFRPVREIVLAQPLYGLLLGVSLFITIGSMIRTSLREPKNQLLLLLSVTAFASNLIWWGIQLSLGIKTVFYPFDLIFCMACFVAVWFKNYFQVHADTKKMAAKLQRADKLKDEFLANTSHELRNPLHSMLNLSQAVLEREKPTLHPQSAKELETVMNVGRRMSLLLNDLLDTMSLRENALRLQPRPFAVQSVSTGVLDMLRYMAEGRGVKLIDEIPEHLPQVFADENRVIQMMFNLLHNALKFTPEGEISVRGYVKEDKVHIAVKDTGIGMDGDTLRRVFEPYEQADSGRMLTEGGFGLGLGISKRLAELQGGTLRVESSPGQGSEFVFTLPLAKTKAEETAPLRSLGPLQKAETAAASAETSSAEASSPKALTPARAFAVTPPGPVPEGDRSRILVVDDDPVNLDVIQAILDAEDYSITTVTSGEKALKALDSREWDLVLSDVMMPRMSGYELARRIRERFSVTELPVLLLTARSQPEDIEQGFLAGANDYVTKPVDAKELRSRVRALTETKRSLRERLRIEAAWLQAQIQPHFLFNALNSVLALSETEPDRMRDLLEVFGEFLRDKFRLQNKDEAAPLEQELSIVRSYLYIEQVRFGDRLCVEWDVDETCRDLEIPMLTIQPLAENAIRHGITIRSRGGKITVRVKDRGDYAEVLVEDDGVGMEEEVWRRVLDSGTDSRTGVGLWNTHLRLKRHYGRGLQIHSVPGQGTSVSFRIHKENGREK